MTPAEKLKAIEDKHEAPYIMTDDTAWLIARVKKLEAALDILSKEQPTSLYRSEMFEIARKALEGE